MAVRLWKMNRKLKDVVGFQAKAFYYYGKSFRNICGMQRQGFSSDSAVSYTAADDAVKTATEVYKAIQCNEGPYYSEEEFNSLYQFLLDMGIKPSTIGAQFIATPDLGRYSVEAWKTVYRILRKNAIPNDVIFKNICQLPKILKFNTKILEENLETYRHMEIGKHSVLQIIERNPFLYVYPPSTVRKKMNLLNGIFPPVELKTLLRNCPNVLADTWDDVNEKIMYIHEKMGLEQPHIADCKALQKSLLHIMTRHQFLYRAGVYVTPNLQKDKMSDRRNPPLYDIMDTSNKYFANKVAKLTEYEYYVFMMMMKEEFESEVSEDEFSESESYEDSD